MQESRKINPLIAIAAISVTLFSLVGIAVMTGLMPSSLSKKNESALEATAPKTQEAAPAARPAASSEAAQKAPPAPAKRTAAQPSVQQPPAPAAQKQAQAPAAPAAAPAPAPVCANCGVVTGINAVKLQGEGSGLGAVAGGVVGGLLGNQVGGGSGKKIATVAGAAGGAYAGHQAEKHLKSTVRYDVTVKMDDGSTRTFSYDAQPAFQAGSKVKVVDGALTAG